MSLSTTLTTSSVVEGKGSPVCALLIGYDGEQVRNSGLAELLGPEPILAHALARLERKGLVFYCGFTPTDTAHVPGISSHWSTAAAVRAARIAPKEVSLPPTHGANR